MVQACRGICVPEWKSTIGADKACLCISGGTNKKISAAELDLNLKMTVVDGEDSR